MDKLQQIKLPIDKEFEEFRRLFDSSLQSSNSLLSEVLSYIKQRNGKMMRPILALLIAKLFGEINDSTLHAALSLELLHTASLVHDDVVDESDKRRGQSSVNAIYNNKVSVLVGDLYAGNQPEAFCHDPRDYNCRFGGLFGTELI